MGFRLLAAAVLPGWLLALLASALITAAGRRWPAALPIQPLVALALVLLPPLALLLWLLLAPRRPALERVTPTGENRATEHGSGGLP